MVNKIQILAVNILKKLKFFKKILSFSMLAMVVVFGVTYFISYQIIVDESLKRIEGEVLTQTLKMDKWLSGYSKLLETLSVDAVVTNDLSKMKEHFVAQCDFERSIVDVYMGFSNDGGIFVNFVNPPEWKATKRPWYQSAMRLNGKTSMIVYSDFTSGIMQICFSKYIGEIDGLDVVLALDVYFEELTKAIQSIELYPGSYSFLTDEEGHILAHYDNNFVNTKDKLSDVRDYSLYKEIFDNFQSSDNVHLVRDYDGEMRYFISKKLDCGWILFCAIPQSVTTNLFNSRIIWIFIPFVCMSLIGLYRSNKANRENILKSSFLAKMSHEIRTPMNAIMGFSELLGRRGLDDDAKKEVNSIKIASNTLLDIINDILDLSKIESGKMEIIEQEYYLNSIISYLKTIISIKAEEKGLLFSVSIAKDVPAVLIGDEVRIRQILLNLLSNAVKYTQEGSVKLNVSSELSDKDRTVVLKYTISDTGIGIKKKDLPKLFDAFARFDAGKNKNIEGAGLGLAITSHLCGAMGGTLSVESVYGKGSEFTAVIPQKIDTYERFTDTEEDILSFIQGFAAPEARILIVDDVLANLKVAEGLMQPYRVQIDTCLSAEEAISKIRDNEYTLVFMDHMMPQMDGIEATKVIRTFARKNLPIVALSANAFSGMKKIFTANGMNDFLAKPIETAKLNNILDKWIPDEMKEYVDFDEEYESSEFVELLRNIDGFDINKALKTMGVSSKSFEKIFKISVSELISNLEKLNGFLHSDLKQYSILIHGMKSALYNIGAFECGNQAAALEQMSKEGADITKHHERFCISWNGLVEKINEINEIKEIEEIEKLEEIKTRR